MTQDSKLQDFQIRIDNIKNQKTSKQTQKDMLSKQYDEEVAALAKLGITDLNNIGGTVEQLKQEISEKEVSLENSLTALEIVLV